jgi:uncharacterized membrane protein YeiH
MKQAKATGKPILNRLHQDRRLCGDRQGAVAELAKVGEAQTDEAIKNIARDAAGRRIAVGRRRLPVLASAAMPLPVPALPAIVGFLDLAGIAVFALTGALLAARLRQDFVTMAFFALVTGVGGGSIRDLLIGAPVFWIHAPLVAPACLAMALLAWFTPRGWWEGRLLEWADAAGLAAYSVLGTVKALGYGVPPVTAALMGVITACVGGIIRDVLAGEPSVLMRRELYVTATALAAALAVCGTLLGLQAALVWTVAGLAGFALRAAAIHWELGIPSYGGREDS